jgi:hypothetical protein
VNSFQRKINLGQAILHFKVPKDIIDEINNVYESQLNNLKKHNNVLAGKIKDQHKVDEFLSSKIKDYFEDCFKTYINEFKSLGYNHNIELFNAWINEMKAGEYNPMHIHRGKSNLGLSSVLCLKVPDEYGKEHSNNSVPVNGTLEFLGSGSGMFNINQFRTYLSVGDLYIFPYDMFHGVYPFHSTIETRRTMSYNCDLINKNLKDYND